MHIPESSLEELLWRERRIKVYGILWEGKGHLKRVGPFGI
jgi:hypothetical protein